MLNIVVYLFHAMLGVKIVIPTLRELAVCRISEVVSVHTLAVLIPTLDTMIDGNCGCLSQVRLEYIDGLLYQTWFYADNHTNAKISILYRIPVPKNWLGQYPPVKYDDFVPWQSYDKLRDQLWYRVC